MNDSTNNTPAIEETIGDPAANTPSTGREPKQPPTSIVPKPLGALSLAGVGASYGLGPRGPSQPASNVTLASQSVPTQAKRQVPPNERILVSLQLAGGLDFLNTVVPLGNNRYRDLRGANAIDEAKVDRLDADFGLFAMPHLASRWGAGDLAIVHGVGWENSTLSHFEASDIWERGSFDSATRTGWLGRTLDHLGGSAADSQIGMSVDGLSPSMYADGWWPASIPADGRVPWTDDNDWERSLRNGVQQLATPQRNDSRLAGLVRNGQQGVFDLADTVGGALTRDEDYDFYDGGPAVEISTGDSLYFDGENEIGPGYVGSQLRTVADLVNVGLGTRVFHVAQDGYDTHANQVQDLPRLLLELDHGIGQFFERLGENADRVVLMTWSEFGRRPKWNGGGTDHGTAGLQFVVGGGVRGGHHGETPDLNRLDNDDNFVPTTDFFGYLGGVVGGVFDIDPKIVVPESNRTLEVVS